MDVTIVSAWIKDREDSFQNNNSTKDVMDIFGCRMYFGEALISTPITKKPLNELQMPDTMMLEAEKLPVPEKKAG